jgi:hypothetical protein
MAKDEMAKLQAGQDTSKAPEPTNSNEPIAEGLDGVSKQDMMAVKAALHMGYAHGLLGGGHECEHPVGSSAHSHYCHGHQAGLKECGMMPNSMQASSY